MCPSQRSVCYLFLGSAIAHTCAQELQGSALPCNSCGKNSDWSLSTHPTRQQILQYTYVGTEVYLRRYCSRYCSMYAGLPCSAVGTAAGTAVYLRRYCSRCCSRYAGLPRSAAAPGLSINRAIELQSRQLFPPAFPSGANVSYVASSAMRICVQNVRPSQAAWPMPMWVRSAMTMFCTDMSSC